MKRSLRDASAAQVLEVVPKAMRFIRGSMRRTVKGEISVPQFRILVALSRRGPLAIGELADHQGVSIAAMSRMVETVERKGLVQRRRSETDRREVLIAATPAGIRKFHAARGVAQKKLLVLLADLSEDELKAIGAGLNVLARLLP